MPFTLYIIKHRFVYVNSCSDVFASKITVFVAYELHHMGIDLNFIRTHHPSLLLFIASSYDAVIHNHQTNINNSYTPLNNWVTGNIEDCPSHNPD